MLVEYDGFKKRQPSHIYPPVRTEFVSLLQHKNKVQLPRSNGQPTPVYVMMCYACLSCVCWIFGTSDPGIQSGILCVQL